MKCPAGRELVTQFVCWYYDNENDTQWGKLYDKMLKVLSVSSRLDYDSSYNITESILARILSSD